MLPGWNFKYNNKKDLIGKKVVYNTTKGTYTGTIINLQGLNDNIALIEGNNCSPERFTVDIRYLHFN